MSRLNIPAGARAVATFAGGWTLYERAPTEAASFLWVQFKLMLPLSTPQTKGLRRTFWLTWNPLVGRLARNSDAGALAEQQPELYDQVLLEMGMSYPKSWLFDVDGRTQPEIDAEVGRLAAQRSVWAAKKAARERNAGAL